MRAVIVRRQAKCLHCGEAIPSGSRAAVLPIPKGPYYQKKMIHPECILPYLNEWWERLENEGGSNKQTRRSRYPREVRTTAHRLQALKCYHKKQGNLEEVTKIEGILAKMRGEYNVVQEGTG